MSKHSALALALCAAAASSPVLAAPGDPVALGAGFTLDPILDARLRTELVDTPALDADAVTLRLHAGAELAHASGLAVLAEGEGTLALDQHYNAFPFAIADRQRRTGHAVIPDPMNVELNRLQLQYRSRRLTLTLGRQRINLDDQRFVGSVAWRQNEQTFDAVRGEARLGPVSLDGTCAVSQRTIFGVDAGPRQAYAGRFAFLQAGVKLGAITAKGFSYLLDYHEPFYLTNASQTYGVRLLYAVPLQGKTRLNLMASFARQTGWKRNPLRYGADYLAGEAALATPAATLTLGYEKLGSGGAQAFQTPLATLHKFNGWADLFLTTPAAGLQDGYAGLTYRFARAKALPGLNATVVYHRFGSDRGGIRYGDEWDASTGFRIGRTNLLAKYAKYDARGFGVDTTRFWLQVELAY